MYVQIERWHTTLGITKIGIIVKIVVFRGHSSGRGTGEIGRRSVVLPIGKSKEGHAEPCTRVNVCG